MPTLRFALFGKPHIYLNDELLDNQISAKARAILFYLAVNQERTSRELLAGLLWSDMPESSARASLRVALSKLRRHLADFLHIDRRNVALADTAALHIDIVQFARTAVTEPRTAVNLYTAPFLHDFYLRDAPSLISGLKGSGNGSINKQSPLLNQLATKAAAAHDLPQAITDLRQLLTLEPWREDAHRQLMTYLMQNGQRGAALAQYDLCRQALQEQLDISPTAETTQLYQSIKTSPPPQSAPLVPSVPLVLPPTPTPLNLPTAPTSFIGRADELAQITTRLTGHDTRLLTITGVGGMGKSRLALEAAHQLLASFTQGVYFVPLVGLPSADLLVSAMAQALGLTLHGRATPQEQLTNYLRHKTILLYLDNFEQLLEGIDLLLDLLTAAPQLKLLITSREPLAIADEWVLPLSGLPYTNEQSLAAQLFAERAQRLDLSFDPTAEQAEINHICTLVEGMPLAIELAAAWVRVIPCAAIATEIQQNLDFLATDLKLVPNHQMSIRAVFRYSWSLLTDEVQTVFAHLAVFRGSFTRESAGAIAGASLRTLSTLVDKSLLQKETHGRFRLHPLLRQFGFDLLEPAAQRPLMTSYATYYADLVQQMEPAMYETGDTQLLADFQADLENIRAVWEWLTHHRQHEQLIEQLLAVTAIFSIAGHYFTRGSLSLRNCSTAEAPGLPYLKHRSTYKLVDSPVSSASIRRHNNS